MKTQLLILLLVAALVPVSFVAAPYREELLLQHRSTTAALIAIDCVFRRKFV